METRLLYICVELDRRSMQAVEPVRAVLASGRHVRELVQRLPVHQ